MSEKEEGMITAPLFRYKNGNPIQFYKCKNCGDIVTGCLHHSMEYCSCHHFVDQEGEYCRLSGEWDNVTENLTDDEKRLIFTKTVFHNNEREEDWIKEQIKHQTFKDTIFDIKEYKRLYKEWKKQKKLVKNNN
jgi:hypothetical protein